MSALCSASGIDTVRYRWRTGDTDVYRGFQRRPEGVYEGSRGENYVPTEAGRLGAYPDGLVYFEGRVGAIAARDRNDHSLASVSQLYPAERVARQLAREHGLNVKDEPAQLGRVDLASELRFSHPQEGSAFLHSLSALDVPWCKLRTDGRKGDHIETVSFHGTSGKTIYLRAYDKGVESSTAPAGIRIRVERQKRFRKDREPSVYDFATSDLRKAYVGREFAKLAELPYATVCDVPDALGALLDSGACGQEIERLAGFLVVGQYLDYSRPTFYRRAAELRALGIFVDPTQVERLQVPIGAYLQALASSWSEAA
jgi:hypothetical protein